MHTVPRFQAQSNQYKLKEETQYSQSSVVSSVVLDITRNRK